jgi:hypothetical protein
MKGPSLIVFLEAGGRRSVYIVRSGQVVLSKGLIVIVVVEAGGRRSVYFVRSGDLRRGVILTILMETGGGRSVCSAVRVIICISYV